MNVFDLVAVLAAIYFKTETQLHCVSPSVSRILHRITRLG